jgi:hypothetical protein
MAKDMFWTTVTFAIIIGVLILAFWPADKSKVVVVKYDCTTVAGQTNVPVTVLEECRKREGK